MFKFFAIGNLTKDAEVKQFDERFAISMSIAVNKKYKDKESVSFLNLTYWVGSDKIAQWLKKGKKIAVSGGWYENTKGNDDRYYQNFTVQELQLLSYDEEGSAKSETPQKSSNTPSQVGTPQGRSFAESLASDEDIDDLEF